MPNINLDFLYTEEWGNPTSVRLPDNSLYLYAHDPEDRSKFCASKLMTNNTATKFFEIELKENDVVRVNVAGIKEFSLHSKSDILTFLSSTGCEHLYLEVTGLSCRIAAPIIKYSIQTLGLDTYIVYAEPKSYDVSKFQNGVNKDLGDVIDGIDPLPGMSNIIPYNDSPIFVALLGFEGGRLSYILNDQDPDEDNIYPIIGLPGYQIRYPYISMYGNRTPMRKYSCWKNLRMAEANSIIDAYMTLKQIRYDNRNCKMIVAPVGTKPHAIGAILYALKHEKDVELVYDNPRRSTHRTDGIGHILSCNISKLYNEE